MRSRGEVKREGQTVKGNRRKPRALGLQRALAPWGWVGWDGSRGEEGVGGE